MKFIEYAEKLETLKYLAERKRTGTANQLSKKLNVSERTIERMMRQLREHGYFIHFNRKRQSYELKDITGKIIAFLYSILLTT